MTENAIVMMSTSIEQAMRPLFLTASIVGLGVYSREKLYLSMLYNLSRWIAYCFLYYYIVTALEIEKIFLTLFSVLKLQIGMLSIILSVIMILYQDKRFRILLKRVAAVDETLTKLGTPRTYGKLHAFSKWTLIAWCVSSFLTDTGDLLCWLPVISDHRVIILSYIVNHYQHVNVLVELIFIILVWYIGTRFDEMCKHLKYLSLKQEHELRRTWKTVVLSTHRYLRPNNYKRVIWTSMHLHLELCRIARELNSMFGIQMTIEITAILIYLLRLCHFLTIHLQKELDLPIINWTNISIWAFVYVIRLFSLNYVCESVCDKANKIDKIVHQLSDILRYADLRNEIYQFVLQAMHRPLKFTGLGLFYFGNSLLWKIFVTITTFVLLMIQMSDKLQVEEL